MVYIPPDEYGKPIMQQALFFQETLGMRVFMCYIVEKPPFLKRLFYPKEKPDIKIYTHEKSKVILNFIRDKDPDMVIIRTHQESNLFNTSIGKFVSELVHNCKIPVFTVNSYIQATPDDYELIL